MANNDPTVLAYPHKSDIYTYRVPTPPRIVVPPPTLNADAVPEITLRAIKSSTYTFLQGVNYDNLVQSNAPLEWAYERRREAQTILPFLCLGPMTAAKDEMWLRSQGITMLLGVRQKHSFESRLMQTAFRTAEKLGLEAQSVDLTGNQDLIRSFSTTSHMINSHLSRAYQATNGQQLGKVLVFCESGNERSAGVVAAYLMEVHEDVDYIKAMQLCQAQRFCVNFDDGMKRLLQGYWDILCAKRNVQEQQQEQEGPGHGMQANGNLLMAAANGNTTVRAKRGLERDEQEDVSMDDGDDLERFGGRNFAPFIDQSQ
ncbi:Putative tyrosine-specific protein phosphatase [Septoria linicola]|uniref:Tyrosine-specific protein phosphatase n=1 Tax=Septoria linicola TaxID=215465 RepID=A0A9Q9ANR0_9PEZI|nr:putative tyrosine-specific protein phosphatase [Septoria linicola]USW49765.1 Putative tyrosine-specific protein phosphatase [Septoria linicola]